MALYKSKTDKKAKDGLALTEWNDLSNAVAGDSGLTLALNIKDYVGIGHLTPTHKLQVHAKDGAVALFESKNPDAYLRLFNKEGSPKRVEFANRSGGRAAIWVSDPGVGDAFNVLANGNVGIGTTTPTEKLEVNGDVKAAKFIGDGSQLRNLSVGDTGLILAATSGNVGIGHPDPSYKLQVHAKKGAVALFESDKPDAYLRLFNEDGEDKRVEFANRSGGRAAIWVSDPGVGDAFNVLPGGNVGIGTASPSAKLHVDGDFKLSGAGNEFKMYLDNDNAANNGKGIIFELKDSKHGNGAVRKIKWNGDNNWDQESDERLKTDIENEDNILDRLMKLNVKNYHWKDGPKRENKMLGFIAQDVEPLFPSLVGEMEDPETKKSTKTLNYTNFGLLAVGAIKELKLEHDNRITALEEEMAGLKKKLGA